MACCAGRVFPRARGEAAEWARRRYISLRSAWPTRVAHSRRVLCSCRSARELDSIAGGGRDRRRFGGAKTAGRVLSRRSRRAPGRGHVSSPWPGRGGGGEKSAAKLGAFRGWRSRSGLDSMLSSGGFTSSRPPRRREIAIGPTRMRPAPSASFCRPRQRPPRSTPSTCAPGGGRRRPCAHGPTEVVHAGAALVRARTHKIGCLE